MQNCKRSGQNFPLLRKNFGSDASHFELFNLMLSPSLVILSGTKDPSISVQTCIAVLQNQANAGILRFAALAQNDRVMGLQRSKMTMSFIPAQANPRVSLGLASIAVFVSVLNSIAAALAAGGPRPQAEATEIAKIIVVPGIEIDARRSVRKSEHPPRDVCYRSFGRTQNTITGRVNDGSKPTAIDSAHQVGKKFRATDKFRRAGGAGGVGAGAEGVEEGGRRSGRPEVGARVSAA